jgi:nickel-type superoxide dismutase maturation protease
VGTLRGLHWPLWRIAVAERSMEPALRPGDWLLVRRRVRPGGSLPVTPGRLVIARHPRRPGLLLVKRAVRQMPTGWWLESDNPAAGAVDSRQFGPVDCSLIEGLVLVRYRRAPGLSPGPGGPEGGRRPGGSGYEVAP